MDDLLATGFAGASYGRLSERLAACRRGAVDGKCCAGSAWFTRADATAGQVGGTGS